MSKKVESQINAIIEPAFETSDVKQEEEVVLKCEICGKSIDRHPRCNGCGLLIGPNHIATGLSDGYCELCVSENVHYDNRKIWSLKCALCGTGIKNIHLDFNYGHLCDYDRMRTHIMTGHNKKMKPEYIIVKRR